MDTDEDGSLKPYTGHYAVAWAVLAFVIFISCACAGLIIWLVLGKG